jgi:hypothetical protein
MIKTRIHGATEGRCFRTHETDAGDVIRVEDVSRELVLFLERG